MYARLCVVDAVELCTTASFRGAVVPRVASRYSRGPGADESRLRARAWP